MFIAALFATAKTPKQSTYPSTCERINKLWYIVTMEYYLEIKINELLTHAITQINLKVSMLSQARKK